ncbi:uncharacterized protein L969DRAFT_96237 [Mixia osmundae IAM 14324]|uniref:uncharacterized protein n=1 Tax=Mixia osmundae (strain CBS 9802 / IAM 14324 / JCM 22182 / KY 12970) TaxID=764103 RepID=UPI0004A54B75|nr:uncharacterized protein L969DRAFT_96237 [Mixia osmundae IAM 14324]KEI37719.1 hypothetical protein L969DRAFT_96237 [Mixia osmundae IAM 14324]
MVAAPKSASAHGAKAQKFTIDFSKPANDKIFDGAAFEKFLHDRIKVDGRTGQLGEKIKIAREGETKIVITANIAFSKRYLKMLTKKYLKKNSLREWLRVVATNKNTYTLKRALSVCSQRPDLLCNKVLGLHASKAKSSKSCM